MAKAILLRGNSGSGKSTVAKLLQRRLGPGTLIVPQDVVRRELLWTKDTPGNPAVALMQEMAIWGSKNCEFVIVEGILYTEIYAPLFEALRAEFSEIHAYCYDIPFEETLRRHKTKPNCHEFGEEAMRRWWRERDFIGFIPEKTIGTEISVDEAVDMILRDVQK